MTTQAGTLNVAGDVVALDATNSEQTFTVTTSANVNAVCLSSTTDDFYYDSVALQSSSMKVGVAPGSLTIAVGSRTWVFYAHFVTQATGKIFALAVG